MAFCGSCGGQLEGNERFCGKCGADQTAKAEVAASVPVAAPVAAAMTTPVASAAIPPPIAAAGVPPPLPPIASAPYSTPTPPYAAPPAAPAPQPYAAPPVASGQIPPPAPGYGAQQYAPPQFPQGLPGQPPIIMGAMPGQTKKHPVMWTLAVVAVVLFGLYEIGIHNPPTPTQPPAQGPQQPGPQGQQPPGPQVPQGPPGQQPDGQGQPGNSAALVQMQSFTGTVGEANGQVQISNGVWTNHATVAVESASLQCVQYAATGTALTQNQTTITGPLQPQSSMNFNPILVGTVVQGATRAQCGIVGVIPAG